MQRYVVRRLLLSALSLLGLTLVVFVLLRAVPGDAVAILVGDDAGMSEAEKEAIRAEFGLNDPLPTQYVVWMSKLVRGDLGTSLFTKRSVASEVGSRFPVSLELGVLALVAAIAIALPVGTLSALKQETAIDQLLRFVTILFLAVPNFWLGTMVVVYGSRWFGWSPHVGFISPFEAPTDNLVQMMVPALVLGTALSASLTRMLRSSMLEVMRDDYVRTARAKGLRESEIVRRHMLKNALIPTVTLLGLQVGVVVGGTVIIESIFNLPGMGRYLVDSIQKRDYPVVQGLTLTFGSFIILVNLLTDLTYGKLDPRISYR